MRELSGALKAVKKKVYEDILMKTWKDCSTLFDGLSKINISERDVMDLGDVGNKIKQITHILDSVNQAAAKADYTTLKKACKEGYFTFALSFFCFLFFFVFSFL